MTQAKTIQSNNDNQKITGSQGTLHSKQAIATINSCELNVIGVTILDSARGKELDGALVEFEIVAGGKTQDILCRLGTVTMNNVFHASDNNQRIISERGEFPYFSKDADIYRANLTVMACCDRETQQLTPRLSPPHSATRVYPLGASGLDKYRTERGRYFTVGHLPNHADIPVTLINRDFGDVENGGWGEAKHTAIFGRNGSGKSVLATTLVAAQLVANPSMGCLIPDTAGDLSRQSSHSKGNYRYDFLELLAEGGRTYQVIEISDIKLKSQKIFAARYSPLVLNILSTNGEKSNEVAIRTAELLFGDDDVDLESVSLDDIIDATRTAVESAFANRHSKIDKLDSYIGDARLRRGLESRFNKQVKQFFTGKYPVNNLIDDFLKHGKIVIITMQSLSAEDQQFVMNEIFSSAKRRTEVAYNASGEKVNSLIVLDEGARWVAQSSKEDAAATIIDAFNTTRKYGLGWMIISQRITAIDKNVLAQCHTRYYGKGLGIGADAEHLRNELGTEGLANYESLQQSGGYFWVALGDNVNIGAGNQYCTFYTFSNDANTTLKDKNPHVWKQNLGF